MAKEDVIELEGTITELLPEGRFRVRLQNDHEILAYTAGRMKKNRIRSMVGDQVTVEMTPYDLERGRITFRHKPEGARIGPATRRQPYRKR
jgi:translation initiation factor IF-1